VAATWPLTGRAEELSLISGLTRGREGPTGVVLAGAAGVGKTRLAREALAAAQQRGVVTRWAVATASARALPLGAFAATVGVVGPDPARLVRQASDALLAGGARAGVIVGVDDGHLLDELSAVLVHQLVLRQAATVVLTLRTGETAPDAITALWKDGHLSRLELQPLSADETATLVEARLVGPVDSAAARRLWSMTRGNALYLRQLVEGELESHRLHQVAGLWWWSGRPELSPGLVELVSARIGQLPDAQRDVMEVLAFGEPLGVTLLAKLTDAVAVEQARRATELGALALAVRIATAAVAAGGGFEPRLLMGNALTWSGGAAEAETELAELATLARSDAERVQAVIPRVFALAWGLARPAQAEAVLDDVGSTVSDEVATTELTGIRSILDASLGRSVQAAHTAAGVLADPRCSQAAEELATWGLAASCGGLGRLDGLAERVRRIDARAEAFETGLLQAAAIGSSWVRGLLLAGLIDQAEQAEQRYRERCQDTPGPGELITSTMCGAVAQARGLVRTAARWFRQVLAGNGNWSFSLLTDLPGVLGMAGKASLARQALAEMTAARNPAHAFLDPELLLARGWAAAAEGAVSQATALARQAAELAASQHQPAAEVLALHTAVCFGDRTVADRLAELATQGRRPPRPGRSSARRRPGRRRRCGTARRLGSTREDGRPATGRRRRRSRRLRARPPSAARLRPSRCHPCPPARRGQ
jgi:hypothetical protein